MNNIAKELVRKSIHLCCGFMPVIFSWNRDFGLLMLSSVLLLYFVAEGMRQRGVRIPIFVEITEFAARSRDEGKFVMGPVTMALGVIMTALMFPEKSAALGIYALAFGDGLASLVGKLIGRCQIPFTKGKTAAGSLACFGAVFISSMLVTNDATCALILACAGTCIELLPLKDLDNFFIPVLIAGIAEIYFHR